MMAEPIYDFCVVGAGMVGSAAAKWLTSQQQETKVCLIGPLEPTENELIAGTREIFGSHYDEGRIYRELDKDYDWGLLAQRSIQKYREIEEESGIKFCHEVGCVFINERMSHRLEEYRQSIKDLNAVHEIYSSQEFHSRYPYLRINKNCECIWTASKAGHISPRRLVSAQQMIAKSRGCEIINEVVVKVTEKSPSDKDGRWVEVWTEVGRVFRAKRVLLCTGAFTNFKSLLPDSQKLDVSLSKAMVVKAEVSEEDAEKMKDMPTISLEDQQAYILPPIRYPDGKYYIKIGLWVEGNNEFSDLTEVSEWFQSHGENHGTVAETANVLREFIPDLKPVSWTTDSCVPTTTPTGRLYCDMLTAHVGVLMGMNGVGAKSSNEIGRMGAVMIAKGSWDYDLLPAEHFKLCFKKDSKE